MFSEGLIYLIKNREDEVDRLEADIEGTKFDMDKVGEMFKARENELLEEADMVQQKNNVLSNLLDLVTERAETTQKELEKYISESEASCPTSPISESAPEKKEKKKKDKEWEVCICDFNLLCIKLNINSSLNKEWSITPIRILHSRLIIMHTFASENDEKES